MCGGAPMLLNPGSWGVGLYANLSIAYRYRELLANVVATGGAVRGGSAADIVRVWDNVFQGGGDFFSGSICFSISGVELIAIEVSEKYGVLTCMVFFSCDDRVFVRKAPVSDFVFEKSFLCDSAVPVFPGQSGDVFLYRFVALSDWPGFWRAFDFLVRIALDRFSVGDGFLESRAVDAMPHNSVFGEFGICFFDLDVAGSDFLCRSFYIYRVCHTLIMRDPFSFSGCGYTCFADLYLAVCARLGVRGDLFGSVRKEFDLQRLYAPASVSRVKLYKAFRGFEPEVSLTPKLRMMRFMLYRGFGGNF